MIDAQHGIGFLEMEDGLAHWNENWKPCIYHYNSMRTHCLAPRSRSAFARSGRSPARRTRRPPSRWKSTSSTSCSTCATRRAGWSAISNKDDFKIFEDGKQQEIKYFNRETDLPLTIGLLIDVSASQSNLIEIEKERCLSVLRLRFCASKDLAFLISFGADAELLQDYTNSPKLLRAGLDGLQVNSDVGGLQSGPGANRLPAEAERFSMTPFTWPRPISSRDRWDARFWC